MIGLHASFFSVSTEDGSIRCRNWAEKVGVSYHMAMTHEGDYFHHSSR